MKNKTCCTDDYGMFINISLLIIRIAVGISMLTHGIPKLVKVATGDYDFPDPIGLGSELSLLLATFAEFFCSILILIGFRSRLASIPLIITMLVALLFVHSNDNIFEHWNILLYVFTYAILLHLGQGKYSLTYFLEWYRYQKLI